MKNDVLFSVFLVFLDGVFAETAERRDVSTLEGDTVTLHANVSEIYNFDLMLWLYGSPGVIIAKLNGRSQDIWLYDVDDGRFRDRLQLDNQTGSLSISDIRTKHSGDYQLKIISSETSYRSFRLTVHDVFFSGMTNKKEGESVTLQTGVNELQKHDVILWMFGPSRPDTFMAEINMLHKISYSADGRLRGRLRLDDQTGSLTITDVRATDTGVYQLQVTSSDETCYKRYNLYVTAADPGVSSGVRGLICVCVLLSAVTAAVITGVYYYHHKYSRLKHDKAQMYSKDEMKKLEESERDFVTPQTGISRSRRCDQILWRSGPQGTPIAQIPLMNKDISPEDDQRFTIDLLYVDSLCFSEGEDFTLDARGVCALHNDQLLWSFGSEETVIAKREEGTIQVLDEADEGRFRGRLQMDDRTGSLTITNSRNTDSGVYHLQISSRNNVSYQKFNVCLDTVNGTVRDSVALNTEVTQPEDGEEDTSTAQFSQFSSSHQRENSEKKPLLRTNSGTSV